MLDPPYSFLSSQILLVMGGSIYYILLQLQQFLLILHVCLVEIGCLFVFGHMKSHVHGFSCGFGIHR